MKTVNLWTVLATAMVLTSCSRTYYVLDGAETSLKPVPVKVETVQGKDEQLFSKQWNMTTIAAPTAWQAGLGSSLVKVAIISTGVDYNHTDLQKNILFSKLEMDKIGTAATKLGNGVDEDSNGYKDDFVGYDFVTGDGMAYDAVGWGTAAAGLIGAAHGNGGMKGINANVSMLPIRYIDDNGQGNGLRLIDSIKYAMANKADVIFIHLVEFPLSGSCGFMCEFDYTAAFNDQLNALEKSGIPTVVSAGNMSTSLEGGSAKIASLFAKRANSIVVTATTQDNKKMPMANYGAGVHIAAPGDNVLTTDLGGGYKEYFGPTVAAAQVAGAVALAISQKAASTTVADVIKNFKNTANGSPVVGLSPTTGSGDFGILNLSDMSVYTTPQQ